MKVNSPSTVVLHIPRTHSSHPMAPWLIPGCACTLQSACQPDIVRVCSTLCVLSPSTSGMNFWLPFQIPHRLPCPLGRWRLCLTTPATPGLAKLRLNESLTQGHPNKVHRGVPVPVGIPIPVTQTACMCLTHTNATQAAVRSSTSSWDHVTMGLCCMNHPASGWVSCLHDNRT